MKEKEKTLHQILDKYTERIHPRREFFRTSLEDVRLFFALIDGDDWIDLPEPEPTPIPPNPPKPPRRRRSYSPSMRTRSEPNEVYHPIHQGIPI